MDTGRRREKAGKLLRARRLARTMTKAELSRRSGLSEVHLYRIERGDRGPSEIALVKLARALDCNVDDLRPDESAEAASA